MTGTPDKFWRRVDRSGGPDACWPWTRARTRNVRGEATYGHLSYQGVHYVAHKLAWILTHGPIVGDLKVLHRCDNMPCCNPAHLFLGSLSDNMVDRRNKGRHTRYPQRDPDNGRWLRGESVPAVKGAK